MLHNGHILPFEACCVGSCSQNLCVGGPDILGVLPNRELHVWDGQGWHLDVRMLRGEVALL